MKLIFCKGIHFVDHVEKYVEIKCNNNKNLKTFLKKLFRQLYTVHGIPGP